MSADDFAILIGINEYPRLGEGNKPASLAGPANDVASVRDWLMDPAGGDIKDPARIVSIISPSPMPAGGAQPTTDELEQALIDLHTMAQNNNMRIGRRLYIFMSGHGYSPGRQRACLFSANAQENAMRSVHATGWLSWLQDSGYFREYVLWMDCCMNRMSFLPLRDPPLQPVNALDPPGAGFVAFAAQRPLRAVERPFAQDGNKTHGVFTWTLLEGLRGAAADVNGRVTGRSLADWIRNALSARMTDAHREDPDVAKEPEVVQEDAGLIFARGVGRQPYPVKLAFSSVPDGTKARIWSGQPPLAREETVTSGAINLNLAPGMYVVDVPGASLRQGFEVFDSTTIDVTESGTPVLPPPDGRMFELVVDPGDPSAEIFVIDCRLSMADSSTAQLNAKLPFGIFKIKTRIGRAIKQHVILLDSDRPPIDPGSMASPPATVAPLDGTAATHEYHVGAAHDAIDAIRRLDIASGQCALLLMARTWTGRVERNVGSRPWEGVSIVDASGRTVVDLAQDGKLDESRDPFGIFTGAIAPGTYYLRQQLPSAATQAGEAGAPVFIEQSLIASAGWSLEVYILRRAGPLQSDADMRPRVSVILRSLAGAPKSSDDEDKVIEVVRTALADERKVLNAQLEDLLFNKFDSPMARLVGGHLLLVEREREPRRDITALNGVVGRLQTELGRQHPDVAALSLMCPDTSLRTTRPITAPPMFQRSWNILMDAAQRRTKLVPAELWERAHALAALPPFLIWTTDESIKAENRRVLARAIRRESPESAREEPVPEAVAMARAMLDPGRQVRASTPRGAIKSARERAARLQVPASALDSLLAGAKPADEAMHEQGVREANG